METSHKFGPKFLLYRLAWCVFNLSSWLIEQALIRVRFTWKGHPGHPVLPGALRGALHHTPKLCLADHRKMGRKRERESYLRGLIMASDNLHQR